jgi:hypothetical protein
MISSALRRLISILALNSFFAAVALGQAPVASTWQGVQEELFNTKHTLYVVTIAHPKTRHTCPMQSIDASQIVCNHHGHATAYFAKDIAALIHRGDHTRVYPFAAGFLAAGGAATWGTVVLASVCAPCAVITAVAALFFYQLAGLSGMLTDADSPDELLYLAPGQALKVSLRKP